MLPIVRYTVKEGKSTEGMDSSFAVAGKWTTSVVVSEHGGSGQCMTAATGATPKSDRCVLRSGYSDQKRPINKPL